MKPAIKDQFDKSNFGVRLSLSPLPLPLLPLLSLLSFIVYLQFFGCRALAGFCACPDGKDAIISAGGLPVILAAMQGHVDELRSVEGLMAERLRHRAA